MEERPSEPWVPRTFSVWVTKKRTTASVKDPSTGERKKRTVDCWDLGGRVDHRFVMPEKPAGTVVPTVFELTEGYYRQHPHWEPKTKMAAAMSFNRARRWFLVPGSTLDPDTEGAVNDYLEHASFLPDHLVDSMTDEQWKGRKWLEAHSAPADSLTTAQVEAFVAYYEVNQRDPSKRLSAASVTRLLQPLKSCWAWAVARDDIQIDRSPWLAVKPQRKVKGRNSLATGRGSIAVDADMVIGVDDAFALAEAFATHGAWGSVVKCFILVMALCGLRNVWPQGKAALWPLREDLRPDDPRQPKLAPAVTTCGTRRVPGGYARASTPPSANGGLATSRPSRSSSTSTRASLRAGRTRRPSSG